MNSLFIYSDTPFFKWKNRIYVFEPTLREVEEIASLFDRIIWMSYKRGSLPERNAREPKVHNIQLICLPDWRGGDKWYHKITVVLTLPVQFLYYLWFSRRSWLIHARGPSVPAFIVLVHSFLNRKKKFWYKYAGDWDSESLPLSYRLQRYLLLKQRSRQFFITINGNRINVHERFFNFVNPCFNETELKSACSVVKDFSRPWHICFVGNLAPFKGALRMVQALSLPDIAHKIAGVWIVGEGPEWNELLCIRDQLPFPLHLKGYMLRDDIFSEIYKHSHFLVLPSMSEGFPKVVAEASLYRCIPVVTKISTIDQYITQGVNGFLLDDASADSVRKIFVDHIFKLNSQSLNNIAENAFLMSRMFTYERFREKIKRVFWSNPNHESYNDKSDYW